MEFLAELWLPILLAAAAAWFWAFLSHAALNLHGKDFQRLADEDGFCNYITQHQIKPGMYIFPNMQGKNCKDPAMKERWMKGPLGTFNLWNPAGISMGRNMFLTYLVYAVVSLLMAYVGDLALHRGPGGAHVATAPDFWHVFQVMGSMGILAYTFAFLPGMIWFMSPCRSMVLHIIDGLVQGVVTGLIFAAMWPAAAAVLPAP